MYYIYIPVLPNPPESRSVLESSFSEIKFNSAHSTFEKNLVKNIVNNLDRVIVSGLALGCDKIAHQTTLDENKTTIAVLPSGIDVITPVSKYA